METVRESKATGVVARPVILKCPRWMLGLLAGGATALLVLAFVLPEPGWPAAISWILSGVAVALAVYALMLVPTRLVIAEEGICQELLFSDWRLRWEDIAEWRHCDGGEEFEKGEMRERTKNRWHSIEFWVRDKAGRKYYVKRWLVFGRRSKQVADLLREHGIEGG